MQHHFRRSLGYSDKFTDDTAIYRCQYKAGNRRLNLKGCQSRFKLTYTGKSKDENELFNIQNWKFDENFNGKQEHEYTSGLRSDAHKARNDVRYCHLSVCSVMNMIARSEMVRISNETQDKQQAQLVLEQIRQVLPSYDEA